MVAASALDILLPGSISSARDRRVAQQLVQSALSDLQQIELLGNSLGTENPITLDKSAATLLRDMYEAWTSHAELLLDRVRRLELDVNSIPGSDELSDAIGRTRARLSVSIADLEQSLDELREGKTMSSQEARRELLLRTEQARQQ